MPIISHNYVQIFVDLLNKGVRRKKYFDYRGCETIRWLIVTVMEVSYNSCIIMDIIICKTCHFNYIPTVTGDNTSHNKYHKEFVFGIKVNRLKSDDEIANLCELKIILISPKSSLHQRNRAECIAVRAKRDTPFDFSSYYADDIAQKDFPLVFIGIIDNHAVVMLVLRKTINSAKVPWELYDKNVSEGITFLPDRRWSLSMIWTLEKERRKGYARQLISVATEYVGISISELAWSAPFTEFGYAFAKTISPNEIILNA
jgi:hypothetical protein